MSVSVYILLNLGLSLELFRNLKDLNRNWLDLVALVAVVGLLLRLIIGYSFLKLCSHPILMGRWICD